MEKLAPTRQPLPSDSGMKSKRLFLEDWEQSKDVHANRLHSALFWGFGGSATRQRKNKKTKRKEKGMQIRKEGGRLVIRRQRDRVKKSD